MTSHEAIMNHFNTTTTGCKKRRESKPQISYEPGCSTITCGDGCRCAMNDGEGGPVSGFIATWQGRYGVK